MKTIFIHVGYGKTGTSAIRRGLADNADVLFRQGAAFVNPGVAGDEEEDPDHPGRTVRVPSSQIVKMLCASFAHEHIHTVIWSNESLWHEWDLLREVVQSVAPQAQVKIVIYFRNHIDWLVSAYLQWAVRHKATPGRVASFQEFVAARADQMNYPLTISKWADVVGGDNVIARSYDAVDNVVADFLKACDLDVSLAVTEIKVRNLTPDDSVLSLFKVYNDQHEERVRSYKMIRLLRRAKSLLKTFHQVDPWPLAVDNAYLTKLDEAYAGQRHEVEREFAIALAPAHRPVPERPQVTAAATNTGLIAILTALIVHLDGRFAAFELDHDGEADESVRGGAEARGTDDDDAAESEELDDGDDVFDGSDEADQAADVDRPNAAHVPPLRTAERADRS